MDNTRVRCQRTSLPSDMIVESRTIGCNLVYSMATENISKSGMLLSWASTVPTPFIEKTILEMVIDPTCTLLTEPIPCLGKVVRKFSDNSEKLGIFLVQMNAGDQNKWEEMVRIAEENTNETPVNLLHPPSEEPA